MKVELKKVENEGFKPFKIEITIETVEELKDLHNRMNVSSGIVNNVTERDWCITDIDERLHEVLTEKLRDIGAKIH